MLPKLVAFVGPIGAGKTTASETCRQLGYEKVSFADTLKKMLLAFGLTAEQVYGHDKETPAHILGGRTPRLAMQTLGTEWGRNLIHKDLWVRAWQFRIQQFQFVTVDDARFPNEFNLIRSLNGVIIEIQRELVVKERQIHESELYDPNCDTTIYNNDTEHKFRLKVISTVKSFSH